MKKLPFFLFLFLFLPLFSWSQSAVVSEEEAVISAVKQLFDGMRAGDSSMIRAVLHPSARLQTTFTDEEGNAGLRKGNLNQFLIQVGTPHEKVFDEKIWNYRVRIEDNLASVWTDYSFFLGEELLHCGVNAFHLFHSDEGWKILQITDSRKKSQCRESVENTKEILNTFIDNWHLAAATSDEDAFFGSMSEDAVYLGTDATERWSREEMREWSKAYFQRESAWDFKATIRQIYLSDNGEYAWWEENLDTWMGECRGSGLLQKYPDGWKIKHYDLSVTLPNDKIKAFMELVKE